jgi:mannose-6-phosphate isomerase-like protein (cupin superfamily)
LDSGYVTGLTGLMISPAPTIRPGAFLVMEDLVTIHASSEQTGGAFLAIEVSVAPGGGPPPLHTHAAQELFWTLSGELTYFREDADGVAEISGGPGTTAFIPSGVPHTYRNFSGEPARYLAVLSPAEAMETFLVEAGVGTSGPRRTPEQVLEIGERYGLVTLPVVPEPRR